MKIAILGSNGLVGTNLINLLSDNGHDLLAIDRYSMAPYFEVKSNIQIFKSSFKDLVLAKSNLFDSVDVVVFLLSGLSPGSKINAADTFEREQLFRTFLDQLRSSQIKKFIFSSTGGAMFSRSTQNSIPEEETPSPISQYAVEKLTFENILTQSRLSEDADCLVVRGANFYGSPLIPRVNHGLIEKLFQSANLNKAFHLFGDGSEVRDFLQVRDVVSMFYPLITENTKWNLYNIGSGEGTTVSEVIRYFKEISQVAFPVYPQPLPKNYVLRSVLDVSRFSSEFGDKYTIKIFDGLEELWKSNRKLN